MSISDKLVDQAYEGLLRERLGRLFERVTGPWFVALGWVALVAVAYWFFDGVESLRKVWPFMTVAALGALVLGLGGWWWFSRTRPAIMVAEFVSVPAADEAAQRAAELLRARVLSELDQVRGWGRAFKIEPLSKAVDPLDDRGTSLALAKARESRVAVVVCGRVVIDDGQRNDIYVITDDRSQRLRPSGPSGAPRSLLPGVVDATGPTPDQAEQAAIAAQLALGLAFLTRGRPADASAVLQPGTSDPHVQFYAAYAAFLHDDYATAQKCAVQSFTLRPWAPAAALASMALRELGLSGQADVYLAATNAPSTETAGPEWDQRIQLLAAVAHVSKLVELAGQSVEWQADLHAETTRFLDQLERDEVVTRARGQGLDDDWAGVRATLAPLLNDDPSPTEAALDAHAAVALSAPDRAEALERAHALTAAAGPTVNVTEAHRYLAEASFALGRLDDADQHWRAFLEGSDPSEQVDAKVLMMMTFGFDADLGPIARTSEEFEARTSPDEAAVRARRAAQAGDLEEASAHLDRFREMLTSGAPVQHPGTPLDLARCYSTLGEQAPTAAYWRAYLAGLDRSEAKLAAHMAGTYLGAMAQCPQVAAVTQEFRPRE